MAAAGSSGEVPEEGDDVTVRSRTIVEYDESWTEPAGKGKVASATALSPMQAVMVQMQRLADIDDSIGKRSEAQQKTLDKVVSMYDRMQRVSLEKFGRMIQPGDEGWRAQDAMPEEVSNTI